MKNQRATNRRPAIAVALALIIAVGSASGALAYWISPSFTTDSDAYFFPNPGCITAGFYASNVVSVHEMMPVDPGTCNNDIGVRVWNNSGTAGSIYWGSTWKSGLPLSGTVGSYKIYHRDSSGNYAREVAPRQSARTSQIGLGSHDAHGAWSIGLVTLGAFRALAITGLGATLMSGCSGTDSSGDRSPPDSSVQSFDALISNAITDARAGGASDGQLAILEAASEVGEISVDQAREAARAVVQCLNDVGIEASYQERTLFGVLMPGYEADTGFPGEGTGESVLEGCETRESSWVSYVYQVQPTTVAAGNAHFEQFVPQAVQCLEDAGYPVDDGAEWAEVELTMQDALQESDGRVNCFQVVIEASLGG